MDIKNLYEIFSLNSYVCNDTRKITKGCIYWALKGERFDGNVFAAEALEKGAAFAVVDNANYCINEKCILLEDSLKALQALATYHRRQLGLPLLAIGGSNGKTTTKELTWRVLSSKIKTFATPGNLNNHIGLPLSLLQLNKDHEAAVLELGANHLLETMELAQICEPDSGIITNIGKDHLDGFGGIEGVEQANMELYDYLKLNNGLLFLNLDDERIVHHIKRDITWNINRITYSAIDENADVFGYIQYKFPFLTVEIRGKKVKHPIIIKSHLFGAFHLYNILVAFAVGMHYGVDEESIKSAIESYIPQNNRSQVITSGSNTFIMDAYNANPSSMQGAVADFSDYPSESKVLLLGDMFELGEESKKEHEAILAMIDPVKFKAIAFAGEDFFNCKDILPQAHYFHTTADLKNWYRSHIWENTVFLLKGSRGMKIEEVIN